MDWPERARQCSRPLDVRNGVYQICRRGEAFKRRVRDFEPIARYGYAREIVGPALLLASDAASMVTGQILAVGGGYLAA